MAFVVMMPGLLFVGLRGGFQQIPINQSQSYYSDHNILNIASVNNAFNLYISIFENLKNFDHDPYVFMDKASAAGIMKRMYGHQPDSAQSILKTNRPNIVLIILESWSADLIEDLWVANPEFHRSLKNWKRMEFYLTRYMLPEHVQSRGWHQFLVDFPHIRSVRSPFSLINSSNCPVSSKF